MKYNFTNWNQFATWLLFNFSLPIALMSASLILFALKRRKVGSYENTPVNLITVLCYAGVFSMTFNVIYNAFHFPIISCAIIATMVLILIVLSYGNYVIKTFKD